MKERFLDWYYTFPIQLVVLHLKSNLFLLFLWVITLMFALGHIGFRKGWMYLFLTPEYFGEVGFWSFTLLGMTFTGFLVTWNITTYILHSPQFPFLAALQRPFTKFFMNNSLIPLGFIIIFLWKLIDFQWSYECWDGWTIFNNVLGFVFGLLSSLILTIIYFQLTNKDIFSFVNPDDEKKPPNLKRPILPGNRTVTMETIKSPDYTKVRSYLNESFKWRPIRIVSHYEEKYLIKVFRQNHANAIVVQTVSIITLIIMGYMIENPYFRIPAGASFFIFLSVITSLAGVLSYWLHKWTFFFTLVLIVFINTLTKYEIIDPKNKAFGLVYDREQVEYTYDKMKEIHSRENIEKDKAETIGILNKWKAKQPKSKLREKPKMVIIGTSGGGLRASLWTMQVIQKANEATAGRFMDNTTLITGASGGMISAAYYRELMLRKKQGADIDLTSQEYLDNTGLDLLNAVIFTLVTNDIFMPWGRFEENGQKYPKDRGYIFEWQMNQNLDNALDKKLGDYREPELNADIPMMFLAPAIVNDGRKLLISPIGVSYMATPPHGPDYREIGSDAIDFRKLMEGNDPDSLRFSTAIRANASFPYILPNVALPTEPMIELVDAGFMDNMGLNSGHRFTHVFKDWIKENTSGIVFVVIRGSDTQDKPISERQGFVESAVNPVRIMRRIVDIQDFEQDNLLSYTLDIFGEDFVDFIPFSYKEGNDSNPASMSLHLTEREKIDVINSFYHDDNQESLKRLKDALR
jgi:hypothetical protein